MKKIFSFMAAALMSVAMLAGENDLLWDYTEGAPSSSPDNGLYWNNKVNDAAGTNNGLKGIKLNSSGYCCFTKAAVPGKLKLSFGPRSGSNAADIEVWNWSMGGDSKPAKGDTKYATTGQQTEYGTQVIELTAEQNDIYLCRGVNTETALQKIQFVEDVARSFVNFKIEFRNNPYTVIEPAAGLPEGVVVNCPTYNGGQHGVQGGTITVPVDGTVKFTIGACQYSSTDITVKKDGEYYATVSNKAACGETAGHFDQNVPYIYTGGAGVLTFELGSQTYVPYFFAEAAEITPCEIIFKDQTGKELGRVETYEGATLEKIPYDVTDLTPYSKSEVFRGWFYTNNKKAQIGDPITGNTTIQAKVTPFERATVGSVQTYNFADQTFYPEDHETVEVSGGSFHDGQHGWYFNADGSIRVQVAGNAAIVVSLCKYSETGNVNVHADETVLATYEVVKNTTTDGTELTAQYAGEAGWVTIDWTAKQYIHKIVVYNVLDFLEKDETTGYYIVPPGDVASFLMALVQAQEGDKIFLPNETYDLGETCLTTISKNNISIIGESMNGTIIRNAPDAAKESIDQTATIKINKNVSGTYLQDLTIQNALDYYKNDNGRAVALWDQGTQTVCKNVKLLSYQDTYYSNLQGAVKYFEDCEIHGTVDFICGDGSVYFKNNLLYCEKRKKNGGGSDALTANNGIASDRGYVFEGCTVKSECPTVSMGRAWNNTPKCTFLNTSVDYSAGEFGFENSDIQRWTKKLMNPNAWPEFGEYNTHLANGTVLTPASNVVTFVDEKSGNATKDIETVLAAEDAAVRTMEWTLGSWATTAAEEAKQAVCELKADEFEPDGIYLVEAEGEFKAIILGSEFMDRFALYDGVTYTVRKANARGGFGVPAGEEEPTGIETERVSNGKAEKIIRNGQVVIVRDNKEFTILGNELAQ